MPLHDYNARTNESRNWHADEHAEIRKMLLTIEQEFGLAFGQRDHLHVVVQQLRRLQCLLTVHFKNEETDGIYSEFPALYPRLTPQLNRLKAQHVELLEHIEQTIQFILEAMESIALDMAHRAFKIFMVELRHHETCEIDLVQSAFCDDIGVSG